MWTAIPSRAFFLTIFLPLIKAGVGVTAFFCFMFSWVGAAAGAHADVGRMPSPSWPP